MKISKPWKIALGIATFGVYILPVLAFAILFLTISTSLMDSLATDQVDFSMVRFMFLFYPIMMCFGAAIVGLYIFYAIHIIKNKEGSEALRILTIIGMHVMPYLAMPAYFLCFIAPAEIPDWAREPVAN